ncbi:HEAT repeat domain-containing protein [Arthrobacter sp. A5]|uniref:HEAT repeat domain-containing protein n=1 Tax=Arthrobacter sp. A5 TaxID=576926 RepID=UPI003DA7D567
MPTHETPVPLDASPADRIGAAVDLYGQGNVVKRALALLAGEDETKEFLLFAGGAHANGIINGAPALYWPELWGARVFMYLWDESAAAPIRAGLGNQAWRVREMCAKVTALRGLPFTEELQALLADDVPRVRAAGARALAQVGGEGHSGAIKALLMDSDMDVRRQAGAALKRLADRFAAGTTAPGGTPAV